MTEAILDFKQRGSTREAGCGKSVWKYFGRKRAYLWRNDNWGKKKYSFWWKEKRLEFFCKAAGWFLQKCSTIYCKSEDTCEDNLDEIEKILDVPNLKNVVIEVEKNDISEQSEDVVSQVMAGRSDEKQMENFEGMVS